MSKIKNASHDNHVVSDGHDIGGNVDVDADVAVVHGDTLVEMPYASLT
jgi:cytidylate kinase